MQSVIGRGAERVRAAREPRRRGGEIPASTLALAWTVAVLVGVATVLPLSDRTELLAVAAAIAPLIVISHAARRARINGRVDLLDPAVAGGAALLLYFGIRGLVVTFGDDRLTPPVVAGAGEVARAEAMMAVVVGCYAAWLGYAGAAGALLGRRPVAWPAVSRRTAFGLGIAVFLLGLPGLAVQSIANQAALAGEDTQLGAVSGIVNVLSVLPFYGLTLLGLSLGRGRKEWVAWGIAAATLTTVGALSLFKEVIVLTVLCCVVPLHYRSRPLTWRAAAVMGAVFFLLVVPAVQAVRAERASGTELLRAVGALPSRLATFDLATGEFERTAAPFAPWRYLGEATSLSSRRLSGIDAVIAVTRLTPEPRGFRYGETLLPLVTGPIPRVLWPDKPKTGLGRSFTERYWARGTDNPSAQPITVIGEGYANFGLVGVALLLAAAGALWRAARQLVPPEIGLATVAYPFVLAAALAVERNVAYSAVNLGQRLAPLLIIVPAALFLDRRARSR